MKYPTVSESGFTLVEVLAALLIFSLAIVGLSRAGAQSVAHTQRLTDKTYAAVVADNQLILARMRPPQIRTESGVESAGGQEYEWRLDTLETAQEGLFELLITVSEEDDVLIIRRAWLSAP